MPKNTVPQKHEPREVKEIQHLASDGFSFSFFIFLRKASTVFYTLNNRDIFGQIYFTIKSIFAFKNAVCFNP